MSYCGVCSISFRKHTAEEIIAAAKAAGLDGIEWGSDVHVPPDDPENAKRIRWEMDGAGLVTLSYGTYFGIEEMSLNGLDDLIRTADILGTDILRIWPPRNCRNGMTDARYMEYVRFTQKIGLIAKAGKKTLCLERHPGMLTESAFEAKQFLRDVGMDNVRMYWQPVQYTDERTNLESAQLLSDAVDRVHVFQWKGDRRYPLMDGLTQWQRYATALERNRKGESVYLLEFMPDDRLESLVESAQALHRITAAVRNQRQRKTIIIQAGAAVVR